MAQSCSSRCPPLKIQLLFLIPLMRQKRGQRLSPGQLRLSFPLHLTGFGHACCCFSLAFCLGGWTSLFISILMAMVRALILKVSSHMKVSCSEIFSASPLSTLLTQKTILHVDFKTLHKLNILSFLNVNQTDLLPCLK